MGKLKLTQTQVDFIRRHAEAAYPEECCGVILGKLDGDMKTASEIEAIENSFDGSKQNRFLITPQTYLRLEKRGRAKGLEILGFYHSHPDSAACPSEYDREHAWPWFSYMIVSVRSGNAKDVRNWCLREDRSGFDPEEIEIQKVAAPRNA